MRNRVLFYTDVQGGYLKKMPFHVFESEVWKYKRVYFDEKVSALTNTSFLTPLIIIRKLPVFALFFENGLVLDLRNNKNFVKRPYFNDAEFIQNINSILV